MASLSLTTVNYVKIISYSISIIIRVRVGKKPQFPGKMEWSQWELGEIYIRGATYVTLSILTGSPVHSSQFCSDFEGVDIAIAQ